MKKPNITEGEWTYRKDRVIRDNDEYSTIAAVSSRKLGTPDWERQNNAKAISAVPDMIDALIEAYDALDNVKQDYSKRQLRSYKVNNSLTKMESALEKAGVEI